MAKCTNRGNAITMTTQTFGTCARVQMFVTYTSRGNSIVGTLHGASFWAHSANNTRSGNAFSGQRAFISEKTRTGALNVFILIEASGGLS
jgi:hypothetical protein